MSLSYSISVLKSSDLNSTQLYSSCVETNLRQVFVDFIFAIELDKQCKHQKILGKLRRHQVDFNSDITTPYSAILSIPSARYIFFRT